MKNISTSRLMKLRATYKTNSKCTVHVRQNASKHFTSNFMDLSFNLIEIQPTWRRRWKVLLAKVVRRKWLNISSKFHSADGIHSLQEYEIHSPPVVKSISNFGKLYDVYTFWPFLLSLKVVIWMNLKNKLNKEWKLCCIEYRYNQFIDCECDKNKNRKNK